MCRVCCNALTCDPRRIPLLCDGDVCVRDGTLQFTCWNNASLLHLPGLTSRHLSVSTASAQTGGNYEEHAENAFLSVVCLCFQKSKQTEEINIAAKLDVLGTFLSLLWPVAVQIDLM